MVEAGLGVVILPALTAVVGAGRVYDVNLYETEDYAEKVGFTNA